MTCAYAECNREGEYVVYLVLKQKLLKPLFCQEHWSDREAVEIVRRALLEEMSRETTS